VINGNVNLKIGFRNQFSAKYSARTREREYLARSLLFDRKFSIKKKFFFLLCNFVTVASDNSE
jgi:hypothetical protein